MREDFLHFLWKYKKFDSSRLSTVAGQKVTVLHVGDYHQLAGPDFFNAQIIVDNQKWAGNIEIHLRSSDWYIHHHETDDAYDNVILHVVWEHDAEVYRKNNTEIPVLELRHYVEDGLIGSFAQLTAQKSWIFCEKQLSGLSAFVLKNWLERLFFERLERKTLPVRDLLAKTLQDWEAVLFCQLARNFGLNTNGNAFYELASAIPYAIIRKESFDEQNLEALLLGYAGLLEEVKQDRYYTVLRSRFNLLCQKYSINRPEHLSVTFFKHRPDNFPTIRLAQLASLYHQKRQLFSDVINAVSIPEIRHCFDIGVSEYWQTHYQFDRPSRKKSKRLSASFVDLLIINTIIPLKFAYASYAGKDNVDDLVALLDVLPREQNAVINKFALFGIEAQSAFESQALLQLKSEYCSKSRCMQCAIGVDLLQSTSVQNT